MTGPNLPRRFVDTIKSASDVELGRPAELASLRIESAAAGRRRLDLVYAPFDHVNASAQIAIVGLTPGTRQAADALRSCRAALLRGEPMDAALADAKTFASFAGPMRRNLVAMLDAIGAAELLGIGSCAEFWTTRPALAHFTSVIRYPLFVDGANWSGAPDAIRTPAIRRWLEAYAPAEFDRLANALLVPLGDAVARSLAHLADMGHVRRDMILAGLPHPSGANAERIACFLGTKPCETASSRTNGPALAAARGRLAEQVMHLARPR